jgi:hypothetical protein
MYSSQLSRFDRSIGVANPAMAGGIGSLKCEVFFERALDSNQRITGVL